MIISILLFSGVYSFYVIMKYNKKMSYRHRHTFPILCLYLYLQHKGELTSKVKRKKNNNIFLSVLLLQYFPERCFLYVCVPSVQFMLFLYTKEVKGSFKIYNTLLFTQKTQPKATLKKEENIKFICFLFVIN